MFDAYRQALANPMLTCSRVSKKVCILGEGALGRALGKQTYIIKHHKLRDRGCVHTCSPLQLVCTNTENTLFSLVSQQKADPPPYLAKSTGSGTRSVEPVFHLSPTTGNIKNTVEL